MAQPQGQLVAVNDNLTMTSVPFAAKRRNAQDPLQKEFGAKRAFFGMFSKENLVRKWCIALSSHRYFDRLIILAIVLNSFVLGLSDFSVVDSSLNPASEGQKLVNGTLIHTYSLRNHIVELSETPFTTVFTVECVIKIIAMGFASKKGSYLRDSWNKLDFVVVVASLVAILPGMPNVSAIRTIRVLRPLRSLSVIPGMRRLISALLKALPALGNVVILQTFVFMIFGILGIQLFSGNMNQRCRLTDFPIKMPTDATGQHYVWPIQEEYDKYLEKVLANPEEYKCLDAPLLESTDNTTSFTKETSPWNTPQDCFWPVNTSDVLLCAPDGQSGNHKCYFGTTCGSNYDTFGNPRFRNKRSMDNAMYVLGLNYGFTNFDNIGRAFFTIFQAVTQEGWTLIMYMVMDTSQPIVGAVFFVVLIIFASFFVMNLLLAVISEEFSIDDSARGPTAAEKKALELKLAEAKLKFRPQLPALYKIVSHPVFSGLIMVVIFVNTVVLGLDHYPMPSQLDSFIEIINFALSCVFTMEMIMKLLGLGLRQYARDKFNVFDAFVVTMGLLETIASPPSFMSDNPPKKGAVSALRSFRLFRVFKFARNWRTLRELLEMIIRAVASIANFAVLLFLFIYIYALVGVQFFGNTMRFDDDGYSTPFRNPDFWDGTVPRNNFDTLLWGVITVFQVITGENWNNIMYDGMRGNGFMACLYFISLVVLGDFILMNLFLALLLDNFDSSDEEESTEKQEEMKRLAQKMSNMKVFPVDDRKERKEKMATSYENMNGIEARFGGRRTIAEQDEEYDEEVQPVDLDDLTKELEPSLVLQTQIHAERRNTRPPSIQEIHNERTSTSPLNGVKTLSNSSGSTKSIPPVCDEADENENLIKYRFNVLPPKGRTLCLLSQTNPIRQAAFRLIAHPLFDMIILGLIVLSSIALAVDNPLANPTSGLSKFLKRMDYVFTVIFLIEMVAKIVALGVIAHKGAYLRSAWNVLDCGIVISSLIMLVAESAGHGTNLKSLRSLRGLRTFRPLRMIGRRPGLKLVVNALIEAIPAVLNVLFVSMLFYLIFSVIAVNYLKGKFYSCHGDEFDALSTDQQAFITHPVSWNETSVEQQSWFVNSTCVGFTTASSITSKYICRCLNAHWGRYQDQNFDNVGAAMLAFFEISTTEGWADVMIAAIDATDIDMQPIRDNNEYWAFFFAAFIMVGSFFVVNLFVGVIIDNFNRMKCALGGDFMLTPEQKKWIEAQKAASRVGPVRILKPPRHPFRRWLFNVVKSPRFEWAIMICIIVNTLLMAAQYFGESTLQQSIINILNEIFAAIFTIEAACKIIASGLAYFEDQWNQFDFFVVIGTLLSMIFETLTGTSVRSLAMLVRVFRVTRILRLVKASKSIQHIMLTLYIALPGLSNITSILFLMMFIYATMGVQLFAKVQLTDNIDSHANFQDFWTAFLFLLRAATGEAWDYCMHDLASKPEGCVEDPSYDPTMCGFNNFEGCTPINGCGNVIAFAYFCSFTLLITYVLLNLTIAVILESFHLSHEDEEPLFEPELLDEFQRKWETIDPKATGFVSVVKLAYLVNIIEPPLGFHDVLKDYDFMGYIRDLQLPLYEEETIQFRDVLLCMTREMVKQTAVTDPSAISEITTPQEDEPSRPRLEFFAHQFFAIRRIQRNVAKWLHTKRELEKQYLEEYKSKIKKPSGRPKKVRDARVYTIG